MTTGTLARSSASANTPTVGSLLSAELTRLRSRRFVQILVIVYFVGLVLAGASYFLTTHKIDSASLARGQVTADAMLQTCRESIPPGESADNFCPPDSYTAQGFIDAKPADVRAMGDNAIAAGVGLALVAFLIGCTAGGADWSQKTMPALLFWEPRRARVLLVKVLALAIWVVVLAVIAQVVWTLMNLAVVSAHGDWGLRPDHLWSALVSTQVRLVFLAVLAGTGAFALANLTRNTGAALGAAFVYFAVAETAFRVVRPALNPYLLTSNVVGLLAKDGLDVPTTNGPAYDDQGMPLHIVHLTNHRAGLTFAIYVALLVIAAVAVFRRRDIT